MPRFIVSLSGGIPRVKRADDQENPDVAHIDFDIPHPSRQWRVTFRPDDPQRGIECVHGCAADGPMRQCFRMAADGDALRVVLRDEADDERERLRDWFSLEWDGWNLTVVNTHPDAYDRSGTEERFSHVT